MVSRVTDETNSRPPLLAVLVVNVALAVTRDVLSETGLQSENAGVYARTNDSFVPLETSVVSTTSTHVVYEASADGDSEFVVGSLEPAFGVRSRSIGTDDGAVTSTAPDGETTASSEGSGVRDEGGLGGDVPSLPSMGDVTALELGIGAGIVLIGGGVLFVLRR